MGAVNPGLYARVPLLARAHELRGRIVKALATARARGAMAKVTASNAKPILQVCLVLIAS